MSRVGAAWLVLCLGSLPAVAHADPSVDPDLEIARRHFQRATDLYAAGQYAEAIVEFEATREVHAVPALDFNIARCHDRLEHRADAIAAYQRYLDAVPHATDAAETRERIEVLKRRGANGARFDNDALVLNPFGAKEDGRTPTRRVGMIAAGVVLAVVGLGLVGGSVGAQLSARSTYDSLSMQCGPAGDRCPDGYTATRDSGRNVEMVSWVLAPIGAVALVTGVALLAIGVRRPEKIVLAPAPLRGGGALAIAGSW
jgi:hypothetical protein